MPKTPVYFLFFLIFLMVSSGVGWGQGVITLPRTGQTKCYDTVAKEIACTGTGQDGELQAGMEWPDPRFTVDGDCVLDNLTGLMWAKNANLPRGVSTWQGALDFVASINAGAVLCGYQDWRLPNVNELESLLNSDEAATAPWLITQGFSDVQEYYYWSSTSYDNTNSTWFVDMGNGYVDYYNELNTVFVWPVRSGQLNSPDPGFPANIWKTGQTMSYATGDDGDLEKGVAWPAQRFTDHGDGTVTDELTGLMWAKNADLPNGQKTWQEALEYIKSVNNGAGLAGYDDWRLPNRKELFSLIDRSKDDPYDLALPAGHPFENVRSDSYWSSTSHAYRPDYGWVVKVWVGYVHMRSKSFQYRVWPVRSGQGAFGNPDISVTPNPASFGNVEVGSTSDQNIAVKNAGGMDLVIGVITNPSPPFTKIFDNCSGQTVTPGGTCTVTYRFLPVSEETFSSSSNIPSNDPNENPKTVVLTGTVATNDDEVTSIYPAEGTMGTEFTITGSGFSTKKGKVLIAGVAPKIAKDGWADDRIVCLLTKVPLLGGSYPYDVTIIPHKSTSPIILPGAFTVKTPEIDPLVTDHGTPGTPITLNGKFFGVKKGKVYLEDSVSGKKKTCKVTNWHMEATNGESTLTFVVPKLPKDLSSGVAYPLKITNKVGTAQRTFTVDPSAP